MATVYIIIICCHSCPIWSRLLPYICTVSPVIVDYVKTTGSFLMTSSPLSVILLSVILLKIYRQLYCIFTYTYIVQNIILYYEYDYNLHATLWTPNICTLAKVMRLTDDLRCGLMLLNLIIFELHSIWANIKSQCMVVQYSISWFVVRFMI